MDMSEARILTLYNLRDCHIHIDTISIQLYFKGLLSEFIRLWYTFLAHIHDFFVLNLRALISL